MDLKTSQHVQRNRFLKLSLKKNREKIDNEKKKTFRDSDVIILDDSFENLRTECPKKVNPCMDSPVVINDSCDDLFDELLTNKEPSKTGNVSLNITNEFKSPVTKNSRPSIEGWSPAQNIICATPKQDTVPSTPQDKANESSNKCSINKIQNSHQKLLSDLYGETWKSIPSLFKTIQHSHDNLNVISKKLQFNDDDDSDKENIRLRIQKNKELYITDSEMKKNKDFFNSLRKDDFERRSKKKLYTEKIPSIPDPELETPKDKLIKPRNANSTMKKTKGLSVTDLVKVMSNDVDVITKKVKSVTVTPRNDVDVITKKVKSVTVTPRNDVDVITKKVKSVTVTPRNDVDVITKKVKSVTVTPRNDVKRLSFMESLADNVPSWRCHPEALQYHDNYNKLKEQLTRRLYIEFNKVVFDDGLEADMPILWDSKLRRTAGTTTNRMIKTARGDKIRLSSIKLSIKVVDAAQRLRDTLIHEMCHAATWIIDGELRAGHGPLWKKWVSKALRKFPELGEISRCHDLEIHYKYTYKCTRCGYSLKRHSKSIDITKKCCGYCRGTLEIIINKKNKDGVVVSTPARKGGLNDFALFVKQNYGNLKDGRTHAQVMKLLGEQFSAKKTKMQKVFELDSDKSDS